MSRRPAQVGLVALVLSIGTAQAVLADQATLYRWVDKNGAVHFTDQSTPGAKPFTARGVPSAASSAAAAASAAQPDPAKSAAQCELKKKQLAGYQSAATIKETDSLGKVHEYSADERKQLVEMTRKQVTEACGSSS